MEKNLASLAYLPLYSFTKTVSGTWSKNSIIISLIVARNIQLSTTDANPTHFHWLIQGPTSQPDYFNFLLISLFHLSFPLPSVHSPHYSQGNFENANWIICAFCLIFFKGLPFANKTLILILLIIENIYQTHYYVPWTCTNSFNPNENLLRY